MKKCLCLLLASVLALGILAGCGGQNTAPPPAAEPQAPAESAQPAENAQPAAPQSDKFTVGIVAFLMVDEFTRVLMETFESEFNAKHPNVDVRIVDGKASVEETIAAIEQFTVQQVDMIVVQPFDANAFLPTIRKALDAGIHVVSVNGILNDDGETPYVTNDQRGLGSAQADYYKDRIPQNAEIAIIKGIPADLANMRREGLQTLMDARPDIDVVAEHFANWSIEEAMAVTEDWLIKFPDLQYIFTQADEMAMGAIEAIRAANKIGEVKVVGIGAAVRGSLAISNGEMDMSISEDPNIMAIQSVELIMKILNGEAHNPHQFLPLEPVDINNVDGYLARFREDGRLD